MTTTHPTVTVDAVDRLSDSLGEQVWRLYRDAFAPLDELAAQRHLMYRAEFDQVMADGRVAKYLAWTDGYLVGVATFTHDLDAVPLISPAYFARRWPVEYRERRIWYVGFLAVAPAAQGLGVFHALADALLEQPARLGGVVGLDVCVHNERRGFPHLIAGVVRARTSVDVRRVDAQSYWTYEFPEPAL